MGKLLGRSIGALRMPSMLVVFLVVMSMGFVMVGIAGCVTWLIEAREADELTRAAAVQAAAWLIGGAGAACAMWALADLVRRGYETDTMLRKIAANQEGLAPPRPLAAPETHGQPARDKRAGAVEDTTGAELLRQIASEVAEIKSDLMLSAEQLEQKRGRYQERRGRELVDGTCWAIDEGDFERAEGSLDSLAEEVPGHARLGQLRQMLERKRAKALAKALKEHVRRVEDLMAVAEFDEAEEVAREFVRAYPGSQRGAELLERTQREAEAYRTQARVKIYKEVQRHAKARRWRAALGAARKLMGSFADTQEGESVALQMSTLEENARIEEARELRDEIRDMIGRRRYSDAIDVAEDLMQRFPETTAAAELRGQVERLRELAAGGD